MNSVSAASYSFSRRLFAAALGAIFIVAFGSLAVQVRGLYGAQGICPVAEFLPQVKEAVGAKGWWEVPTIFWFGAGDLALVATCWMGVVLGCLLALGRLPGLMALLCWALYLSFCSVGNVFLNFQWDALLLETAVVAGIALPWSWRPDWSNETPVQRVGRWALWWLLFRLMFESGMVKFTWNDPTWWHLTALEVHFETQPIPNFVSWYFHQLPPWILRAICAATCFVEIVVPFLIFFPRRWRHGAGIALVALQVGILVTGNFAFFNWLTIALCLPLFDDEFWRRDVETVPVVETSTRWQRTIAAAIGIVVLALSAPTLLETWQIRSPDLLGSLRSFNSYGLFRVMTVERPEIVIEGSRDGVNWQAYEFPWKPGNVYRAPGWIAPFQPRLDWQMWFAALEDVRQNPWFVQLLVRLLEGSPDVLRLLKWNPFPESPPKYIRATLYDYHFTRRGDDAAAWWKREAKGSYLPPISLRAPAEMER